jgi:hypothetical protein
MCCLFTVSIELLRVYSWAKYKVSTKLTAQQSTAPGLQTNYKIQSGIMEILKESIPGFFNNW